MKSAASIPRSYTVEKLVGKRAFREGLALAARELLETHRMLPREVHYVADLQRWMLSQIAIAMHFEHQQDPASPPLSPGNLVRVISGKDIASRNTVHHFLMELRKYGFVTPLQRADRRQRAVEATPMSEQLIRRYFDIHLRALDVIDNGTRYALSCQNSKLLHDAQPRFMWSLIDRNDWHNPPQSIAKFVSSDSGSSVLHDLIEKAPTPTAGDTAPIGIGRVSPQTLSSRYQISRTHTARLLAFAREAHLIGWANKSNRGACWISPRLVRDYLDWQAIKLVSVSEAFEQACLIQGIGGTLCRE